MKKALPLVAAVSLAFALSPSPTQGFGGTWKPQGPGPMLDGQVENLGDDIVTGAVQTVAAHPTDPDILYVGAVNGGIWRTDDATANPPTWQHLTTGQEGQSIGALEFDPTDPSARTLLAGTAGSSSFFGDSGSLVGLLHTTDAGASWRIADGGGTLASFAIDGVAARGDVMVVASTGGLHRSTDGGVTFQAINNPDASNGLPSGPYQDLAGDPVDLSRLFVATTSFGEQGIYRSTDIGATWMKVSTPAIDGTIDVASNIKIAVGPSGTVAVAVTRNNQLAGVFHSPDHGASWLEMDLPGGSIGIHPGQQGRRHMSLAIDPSDANLIYIGGDRQDFPSDVGASDFTGRLFRGDASQPPGSQWQHLTHSQTVGAEGGGTASRTAPHADSRDMIVDARGDLIEVDDGGVYRRTSPRDNTGDWFSINGNLQTVEMHAAAYDRVSGVAIGGSQDNGTSLQLSVGSAAWLQLSGGDGGKVAVNDRGLAGQSVRYTSSQFLHAFRRRIYDASNSPISQEFPALEVVDGGADLEEKFYTPVVVNAVDPTRLLIGGANSVYESFDEGTTLIEAGPGVVSYGLRYSPIVYGHGDNADLIWVGALTSAFIGDVFIRTGPHPAPLVPTGTYPGSSVNGIALDPAEPMRGFVIEYHKIYQTTDGGASWTDISGDLTDVRGLRSVLFLDTPRGAAVAVGTGSAGVLIAFESELFASWRPFGNGSPRVPIYQLEYEPEEDLVLAATLGRGVWTMSSVVDGLFEDGFESGNTDRWSSSTQP